MNTFLTQVNNSIRSFAKDEEGAQIIEYALIIAVVSIALIVAMAALAGTDFSKWIDRVGVCLTGSAACV
ncbi:pilus assembly protein PilA [Acidovorax sp. SRB_14]|uniref:Flp family type IVb pilin n=1 Tax=Acidovorax sp. SRB_14 TaxID=1962699 RepID=UPI0015661852|nr:Flp family type IVb pilin [Acidovorax sp. SRB_14]NMM79516.1 pilus assembly protein PilA [Acidovorax sp. SRB_14]